jgi:hypothetical protein
VPRAPVTLALRRPSVVLVMALRSTRLAASDQLVARVAAHAG